jgi:hypothetical protein
MKRTRRKEQDEKNKIERTRAIPYYDFKEAYGFFPGIKTSKYICLI